MGTTFRSNNVSLNIPRPPFPGSNNNDNYGRDKIGKLPKFRQPISGAKRAMTTTEQQQQQAFRQKVATANEIAICTATSKQVGRRTLRQLLLPTENNNNNDSSSNTKDYEAYIVPIFQRRYCWTIPQWDTLWMDFTKRSSIRHSLGRLTCTNVPEKSIHHNRQQNATKSSSDSPFDGISQNHNNSHRSIIIDGQQRFTTVTLILAAIRDALLSLNDSKNDDPLLESIHRMIFLDVPAMNEWIGAAENTTLDEGMALEFCRLIPTYCDRSSYLAAILPPTSPQVRAFLSDTYNPRWHRPVLAKRHFARKIDSLLSSSNQQPRQVLDRLTKSLLDGIDILYFPVDVSRGYQDGTEDTQVIYERLAIRDATWCKPTRSSEYHSMDGIDMIRNLFLGSFDTPDSKTNFYKTYWLPLERMYQTTTGTDTNEKTTTNNNKNNEEEEQSVKSIVEAFLEHERSKLNEEERRHQPWAKVQKVGLLTAASMDIGGRIYKDFESWMAYDYRIWQQQTTQIESEDKQQQQQQQQWSVSSLWTTSTPSSSSSSHSSAAEDHTRDVGKRLLEFAKGRRTRDGMSR